MARNSALSRLRSSTLQSVGKPPSGVVAPPQATIRLSPTSGPVGTNITVTGSNSVDIVIVSIDPLDAQSVLVQLNDATGQSFKLEDSTGIVIDVIRATTGGQPMGIAVDGTDTWGRVFVADRSSDRLTVIFGRSPGLTIDCQLQVGAGPYAVAVDDVTGARGGRRCASAGPEPVGARKGLDRGRWPGTFRRKGC